MITVSRAYYHDCTLGRLFIVGFSCHTLELPWLGNQPEKSCIPEGVYDYRVSYSPARGKEVVWIDGVPERTAIQVHSGNYTSQVLGCCLVGDGVADINKDGTPDVTNSGATFDRLLKLIPKAGKIQFTQANKPYGVYK